MSEPVDQSRLLGPDIPGPVDPPERNDMQLLDQLLAQAAKAGSTVTVDYGGEDAPVTVRLIESGAQASAKGDSLSGALAALFDGLGLPVDTRAPGATEWKANADFAARQTQALEALTAERDRLVAQVTRLHSVLAAANADCDERGRERDRLHQENRNLRGSVERLEARLADMTPRAADASMAEMYRSQRDTFMGEVERLRVEVATSEEEAIHARSERDDLRERMSSVSAGGLMAERLLALMAEDPQGAAPTPERKLYDYMVLEYRRDYAAQDIQDFAHTAQAWRLVRILPKERLVIFEREITDMPDPIDSDLGALVRETLDLGGKLVIFTGDSVEDAVSIKRTGPGEPTILAEGGDIETAMVEYRTLEARNDG